MNRLEITVPNVLEVLLTYTEIEIYSATSQAGPFNSVIATLALDPADQNYYYDDLNGTTSTWYVTDYYNPNTSARSSKSSPMQGGVSADRVGYSFNNYKAPPNEWGEVLTADDMRYTYMWGIDAQASNAAADEFTDDQYRYLVKSAVADWERFLKIDIQRRKYLTLPDSSLKQSPTWNASIDYTDEDSTYDFDPKLFENFGFLQLRHYPVISVDRCKIYSVVGGVILDILGQNWLRLNKKYGQLNMYPTNGYSYGPFAFGINVWRLGFQFKYPDGIQVDYQTGFANTDLIPPDLRNMIGMWASLLAMSVIGDGLLAGFASESVSLDGLSESFTSTQSAENPYFGGRIRTYERQIQLWISRNRYSYRPAMSFVGV